MWAQSQWLKTRGLMLFAQARRGYRPWETRMNKLGRRMQQRKL
jgi:hypothetical protein